jgi:hypothetical protein
VYALQVDNYFLTSYLPFVKYPVISL